MHKEQDTYSDDTRTNIVTPLNINKDTFITSSLCSSNTCVGIAIAGDDEVLVQDTKNLGVQPLKFNKEEWRAFIEGVKKGEFDV